MRAWDFEHKASAMGATRDDFVKYPRTPHLFGSKGTDDDTHMSARKSASTSRRPVA